LQQQFHFFTCTDDIYGIKLRYPHNWNMDGTNYPHGVAGLQIVALYLPDSAASMIIMLLAAANIVGFPAIVLAAASIIH
jgi:hypothetical protein